MGKVIEGQIPTLFGGVSTQPDQVRQPNQLAVQDNALSSVVTGGFEKRPATQHVSRLAFMDSTKDYKIHAIDRDANTQLMVAMETGTAPNLFVFDAQTGTQKTVAIGDTVHTHVVYHVMGTGTGVLQLDGADFEEQLAFASGETTFDWSWDMSDATTGRARIEGSADGITWNTIKTTFGGAASGTFSTTIDAVATGDHNYIRVYVETGAASGTDTISVRATFADMTYLLLTDPEDIKVTSVADYTFITNRFVATRMENSSQNSRTTAITATYQTFGDLPSSPSLNQVYRVAGTDANGFGEFYVLVTGTTPTVYEEIADPTGDNTFAENSMPHQLVRSADGETFTFSAATWDERDAGNELVNPAPGFIGGTISDVAFYRNRLVLVSDETCYLSQSANVFALFAQKATEVLDSDPIERGATTNNVNILQYAVTFRKLLFMTSANAQFELDSGDRAMSPENARLDQATTYQASTLAKPVPMGDVLFFPAKTEGSAVIYEYFFQDSTFNNTALDISRHVRTYIGNDILELAADPPSQALGVLTTAAQNALYMYRTFFDGGDKLQSSWSRYLFGASEADSFIHGIAVFSSFMYLVIGRQDGYIYLEQFPLEREANVTNMPFMPLVDQRTLLTGTYNSTHDTTYWTTPWYHSDDAEVVIGPSGAIPGQTLTVMYTDKYLLDLLSVAAGETLIIGGKTFTAHATTTTTANREFSISGSDIADAGELVTCLNDTTDGIGLDYLAVDNGDATISIQPLDAFDGTLAAPTGTAITSTTIVAIEDDDVVAARGDHSAAPAYVGRKYTMTAELSKIYPQEDGNPIVTGRLQLQDLTVLYENTGYFELKLTPDGGRPSTSYKFEGKTLGDSSLIIDSPSIAESGFFGHKKVLSRAEKTKVEIINDTPEPCVITAVQWRGFFNETGRSG